MLVPCACVVRAIMSRINIIAQFTTVAFEEKRWLWEFSMKVSLKLIAGCKNENVQSALLRFCFVF